MTAKEMFEALDFELVSNCNGFTYCKKDYTLGYIHIRFDNNCKIVEYYRIEREYIPNDRALSITIRMNAKLYQAITQQMKELGWVE